MSCAGCGHRDCKCCRTCNTYPCECNSNEVIFNRIEEPNISNNQLTNNKIKLGRYKNFKGKEYRVIHLAFDSETMKDLVVYQALYGEGITWVSPATIWNETVEWDNKRCSRFTYVGE